MKKLLSLFLAGVLFGLPLCLLSAPQRVLAQSAIAATVLKPEPSNKLTLKDGTEVKLRVAQTVSSATAKTGDAVGFKIIEDVRIGDTVVIPAGATALGTVTIAKPRGRAGRGGKLSIAIDSVRLNSGEKVLLRAIRENNGESSTGTMTGAIVATSILFFPVAPLFLFMRGKDISIPEGTGITAYTEGNFLFDSNNLLPVKDNQTAMNTAQMPNPKASDSSSISIKSAIDGAEILIDGKFAGNTPSTLVLKSGEHTISVKKEGYATWERTITVNAGSNITLDANLNKIP